jgi:hypothetical protein
MQFYVYLNMNSWFMSINYHESMVHVNCKYKKVKIFRKLPKFVEDCPLLHPIVFNDLYFCDYNAKNQTTEKRLWEEDRT